MKDMFRKSAIGSRTDKSFRSANEHAHENSKRDSRAKMKGWPQEADM